MSTDFKTIAIGLLMLSLIFTDGSALAQARTVPPDQWWGDPCWSPDGAFIAVQSTPPGRTSIQGSDGKTYYGYTQLAVQNTMILRSRDYSLVSSVDALFPHWSPNSKRLAADTFDTSDFRNFVKVYDAATGAQLRKMPILQPSSFAWSPDSDRVLVTQRESISICDLKKKIEIKVDANAIECNFQMAAWSPDGKNVAASGAMKSDQGRTALIRIWNAETGAAISKIELSGQVKNIAWSPDGQRFIYSVPGSIILVDTKTNKTLLEIKTLECVTFGWSPQKKLFVYKDGDYIHLLNSQTLVETVKVQGSKNGFFGFALSPDERFLLINGKDTVAVCDAETGKYLAFKTFADLSGACWAPDGKSVVVSKQNFPPELEPVRLTILDNDETVFTGGSRGSPGWEHYPSPKNLEECFADFDRGLSLEGRERFKSMAEDRVGEFGGGSIITDPLMADVYCNWGHADLQKFFAPYGITDLRDVHGIVLDSYWRHLNGRPVEFEQQARKHKAWWDSQMPVVSENRPLRNSFLNMTATDPHFGPFSIGSVKGKLKIVSFIDTDSEFSAALVKGLQRLRTSYPSADIAFVVFVIPPENMTKASWPAIRLRSGLQDDRPAKDIAAFQSSRHDGIIVGSASEALCKELFEFADAPQYSVFCPPQTLVLTGEGQVKMRINGVHREAVLEALESQINAGKF